MKTNYEKIKAIIESGHIAQVYDKKDKKYCLFSSIRSYGSMRSSYWENNLQDCYDDLGLMLYNKNEINYLENITISVYQRPVRYAKVGDKVQILESVKQSPAYNVWKCEAKEMIGGPFEVMELDSRSCIIYTKDKSSWFYFDYRHLAPRIEEEESEDILIKDGKKYRVQILEEIE